MGGQLIRKDGQWRQLSRKPWFHPPWLFNLLFAQTSGWEMKLTLFRGYWVQYCWQQWREAELIQVPCLSKHFVMVMVKSKGFGTFSLQVYCVQCSVCIYRFTSKIDSFPRKSIIITDCYLSACFHLDSLEVFLQQRWLVKEIKLCVHILLDAALDSSLLSKRYCHLAILSVT